MFFHKQNLNEDRQGNIKGSIVRHGRCWWHFSEKVLGLGVEWTLFHNPRFGINLGLAHYDCALSFGIQFLIGSLHVHLNHHQLESWLSRKTKRADQKYGNGRAFEFYWYGYGKELVMHWYSDPMESRHDDPWYHHFRIDPRKILLGKSVYSERTISEHNVVVPMPEGAYPATVKLFESTWKRPRWPWPLRETRSQVEIEQGIPHEGKGENSWDCGKDACFGMTCGASTVEGAIGMVITSVLRDRRRYDGNMMAKYPPPQELQKC